MTLLWPEFDPLFPRESSDAASWYYADADVRFVTGIGHFAPLEYPAIMADAVLERIAV